MLKRGAEAWVGVRESDGALANLPSSLAVPLAKSFRQHVTKPHSLSTDTLTFMPFLDTYVLVVATK